MIHSTFQIEPRFQHLFVDGKPINGLGSSMLVEMGLKNGDKIVVVS
jgi:hypothetical protein